MVYIVGILGFVGGFAMGLWLIAAHLKNVPRETLLNNKDYHKKYGIWPWVTALICCLLALYLYNNWSVL